ncbi:response regulator transcription factor [Halomonas sp. 328]|uniref:response regulator transcription factor n=1 Tax=Halomonas sp. 328 TaxID=2776704 RepID=UPI0018A6EC32|nr:response regulator transcription factor [Halomonas sp. 328]MBF8222883.1 response regulator transcription factor [Halomonas sp. 328]
MPSDTSYRPHLLVIEDDPSLNDQIARLLESKGYRVAQSLEGEGGLIAALSQAFDLILLDARLPRLSGFEVLERLRHTHQTPVMLTACGAEEERIRGYRRGADDCLPKPFDFTELHLRIEALLRRTLGSPTQPSPPNELRLGPLRLDRSRLAAHYGDTAIPLTPIQFRLLWVLLLHRGEVLSKPYLYQRVLEREFCRYDRSLDMHLSRVRRKLVDAGMAADRLQTVHGKGYGFL